MPSGSAWPTSPPPLGQARDLDQALDCGHRALEILARVSSARAEDYLRAVTAALAPWAAEARVRDFTERLRPAPHPRCGEGSDLMVTCAAFHDPAEKILT